MYIIQKLNLIDWLLDNRYQFTNLIQKVKLMNEQIKQYWHKFCQKHNLDYETLVEAWTFGATQKDADELASLVDKGIKTATTSAYELYSKDEAVPKVGEWSIILDGNQQPVCVIRECCVEIIPYNLISKEHAYHEGEGDRSYEHWRRVHDDFLRVNIRK